MFPFYSPINLGLGRLFLENWGKAILGKPKINEKIKIISSFPLKNYPSLKFIKRDLNLGKEIFSNKKLARRRPLK